MTCLNFNDGRAPNKELALGTISQISPNVEPIPQGGYACYIPSKSRQDTVSSRFSLLERRMNQLEIENKVLKQDVKALKSDNSNCLRAKVKLKLSLQSEGT